MDRRTAINRISLLLGAAVSAPTAAALLSGCRAPGDGYRPRTLTPEAYSAVGRLAEVILPETDTPGAREAGVHGYVDMLLSDYYPQAEVTALRDAIAALRASLLDRPTEDGAELTDQTLLARVSALDAAAFAAHLPDRAPGAPYTIEQAFKQFKELVIAGYYTSELAEATELLPPPMGPYIGDAPLSDIGRTWA